MNIFRTSLFKLSYKINDLLCLTLLRLNTNFDGTTIFEKKSPNILFAIRIISFTIIVTIARMPRYLIYFSNLYIVRGLYLVATILSYIYLINDSLINIYKSNQLANILNDIVSILNKQSLSNNKYFRKQLLIEYVTIITISLILLHLDYLRGIGTDFIGYTIPEIIIIKSILFKCFILSMLKRGFLNCNEEIDKKNKIYMIRIAERYKKLINLCIKIDNIYGTSYLLLTIKSFIFITYNFYKIVIFYQNSIKFPTPNIIVSWYMTFIWIPIYTLHLTLIIYHYDGIKENIGKFAFILNNRYCQFNDGERKVYGRIVSKLFQFISEMLNDNVNNFEDIQYLAICNFNGICLSKIQFLEGKTYKIFSRLKICFNPN